MQQTANSLSQSAEQNDDEVDELVDEIMGYEGNPDAGTINCEVLSIHRGKDDSHTIVCEIDTPVEKSTYTFDFPYSWRENNGFVKFVQNAGYAKGNFNELVGESVELKRTGNDNWELCDETHSDVGTSFDDTGPTLGSVKKNFSASPQTVAIGIIAMCPVSIFSLFIHPTIFVVSMLVTLSLVFYFLRLSVE